MKSEFIVVKVVVKHYMYKGGSRIWSWGNMGHSRIEKQAGGHC